MRRLPLSPSRHAASDSSPPRKHVSIRAVALGVDAESPYCMFDDRVHTKNFLRSKLDQSFWTRLEEIRSFVGRMAPTKTLHVAHTVMSRSDTAPFVCVCYKSAFKDIAPHLSKVESPKDTYLFQNAVVKEQKRFLEAFVETPWNQDGTYRVKRQKKGEAHTDVIQSDQMCFVTLLWRSHGDTGSNPWCIVSVPEELQRDGASMDSMIFATNNPQLGEKYDRKECIVLSRFENTAAVVKDGYVDSQMTWRISKQEFEPSGRTLWIGGGGGNDVVSACLMAKDGDTVMNSIGIRQFLNWKLKSEENGAFFERFYTPDQGFVINISELVGDTYAPPKQLEDTGTILFEVEMALQFPKITIKVCILPFVHKDYKELKENKQLMQKFRKVFPQLFVNGEFDARTYTSIDWETLMLQEIEAYTNVVCVDTGGDIVTGGNDSRGAAADTVWIPLLQNLALVDRFAPTREPDLLLNGRTYAVFRCVTPKYMMTRNVTTKPDAPCINTWGGTRQPASTFVVIVDSSRITCTLTNTEWEAIKHAAPTCHVDLNEFLRLTRLKKRPVDGSIFEVCGRRYSISHGGLPPYAEGVAFDSPTCCHLSKDGLARFPSDIILASRNVAAGRLTPFYVMPGTEFSVIEGKTQSGIPNARYTPKLDTVSWRDIKDITEWPQNAFSDHVPVHREVDGVNVVSWNASFQLLHVQWLIATTHKDELETKIKEYLSATETEEHLSATEIEERHLSKKLNEAPSEIVMSHAFWKMWRSKFSLLEHLPLIRFLTHPMVEAADVLLLQEWPAPSTDEEVNAWVKKKLKWHGFDAYENCVETQSGREGSLIVGRPSVSVESVLPPDTSWAWCGVTGRPWSVAKVTKESSSFLCFNVHAPSMADTYPNHVRFEGSEQMRKFFKEFHRDGAEHNRFRLDIHGANAAFMNELMTTKSRLESEYKRNGQKLVIGGDFNNQYSRVQESNQEQESSQELTANTRWFGRWRRR